MSESELFKTFWGHVQDLRSVFIKMASTIGVGILVALVFYKPIFEWLILPLEEKNHPFLQQVIQKERVVNTSSSPQMYELPEGFLFLKADQNGKALGMQKFYRLLPGDALEYEVLYAKPSLQVMSPLEGFIVTFKVAFWVGIAVTSPVWVWTLLGFILPALYAEEKKQLKPFLFLSFLFLGAGVFFAYFITLPLANRYLASFNSQLALNHWTLSHYVDYTALLFLGHAIAFELSLILFFLVHVGVLSKDWLVSKRRYMIVLAFIIGALLTPPDVVTQLLLAIPLVLIYELAIYYATWRSKAITKVSQPFNRGEYT